MINEKIVYFGDFHAGLSRLVCADAKCVTSYALDRFLNDSVFVFIYLVFVCHVGS